MASRLYAGLDIGTTRIKLHLYDEGLDPVKQVSVPSPLVLGRGRAEHDPHRLAETARKLAEKARRMGAVGLGVATYRASPLAWSPGPRPLSPVILWLDRDRRLEAFRELPLRARIAARLPPYKSILSPASPLPVISRLARASPGATVWTVDAYIAEALTGEPFTDPSNAALTGLISPWSLKPLPMAGWLAGIPRGYTPPPIRGNTAGHGLLAALVADQQAGLIGLGCLEPGCVKLSLGTGAFADAPLGRTRPGLPGRGRIPLVVVALEGETYYAVESLVPGLGVAVEDLAGPSGGFEALHSLAPRDCALAWQGALLLPYPAGPGAGLGQWSVSLVGERVGGRAGLACALLVSAGLAGAMIAANTAGTGRLAITGGLASIPMVRRVAAGLWPGEALYCAEDPTPRGAAVLAAHARGGIDARRPPPPRGCEPLPRCRLPRELLESYRRLAARGPGLLSREPWTPLRLRRLVEYSLEELARCEE